VKCNSTNLGITQSQCAIVCDQVDATVVLVVFQEAVFEFVLSCTGVVALAVSVPVATSASVAISISHLLLVVAKSLVCITKFVPSYCNKATPFALITPVCGSLPSNVLIFFAHKLLIFRLQAPVLVVVNLHGSSIPVV